MCSFQTIVRQDNKGLCTLVGPSDVQEGGGGRDISQPLPEWYIRPSQSSVALHRTALTFQLCSNYIHVRG